MIVFIKADGTAIDVAPSPVYQGSSLSGSLYLVAPFPRTNAVTVAFQLSDGDYTENYAMTSVAELEGVTDKLGDEYSVWEWQTNNALVTAKAGMVTAQFTVSYYGELVATSAVNFTVQKGILPLPPTEPTADQWQVLIDLYGDLTGRVTDLEDREQMKVLVDFTVNDETGEGTKYYSDGTTANVMFPTGGGGGEVVKTDFLRVLDFTEDSFVGSASAGYELAFGAGQTGFDNSDFIVMLERGGAENYEAGVETTASTRQGYYTQSDTVFIGSDGSVLLTANTPYSGRLLALGGSVWSGKIVIGAHYDLTLHRLTLEYANGEMSDPIQFESKLSQFANDTGFATYSDVLSAVTTEATDRENADTMMQGQIDYLQQVSAASLLLTLNPENYVMTAQLKNATGETVGEPQTIDLPLESVVVGGEYDEASKTLKLTLENGNTVDIPIGELISGLLSKPDGNPTVQSVVLVNTDGSVEYGTIGAASRYTQSYTASNWTGTTAPYSISIAAATHGKGLNPIVQAFDGSGNQIVLGVNKNTANGNITLYSSEKIAFTIVIM